MRAKYTLLGLAIATGAMLAMGAAAPQLIDRLILGGPADAGGFAITNAGDVVTAAGKSLTTVAGLAEAAIQPSTVISNLTVAPATPLRTEMVVAGFGEAEVNGTYAKVDDINGYSAYQKSSGELIFLQTQEDFTWQITSAVGTTQPLYVNSLATPDEPDLVTTWTPLGEANPTIGTVTPDYGDPVTVEDLQPKPGGEFVVINTTNLVFITSGNTATNSIIADITASVLAE